MVHLGGQQACQVDLGDHLAAAVALARVCVVVVLDQVPQLGATLQVWRDHGRARTKAVWTAGSSQHALYIRMGGWEEEWVGGRGSGKKL